MADLHFETPLWLLALLPLGLLLWALTTTSTHGNSWKDIIDQRLQPLLLRRSGHAVSQTWLWLLASGWFLTVIALANPAWEHKPRPVFQTDAAQVIVLDLSSSMQISDIKPSRLARAKFKIEDILSTQQEGQTGLVVFAGDAFAVTPLTRDNETLRSLLATLDTRMMPVQGSRADLGLIQAGDLLKQAGVTQGQILLIADGAERNPALAAAKSLHKAGHRVSVLGVGTAAGGPLPNLHDHNDKPIVVPLQETVLQQIASAGGGIYRHMVGDDSDIQALIADMPGTASNQASRSEDLQQQDWVAEGPWLVLLLLPLAALAFRRGWIMGLLLAVSIGYQPAPLLASPWENLWQRQDQQADKALRTGDYEQAEKIASDPLRKGSAAYKAGRYTEALQDFSQASGADAAYNRGNALARLGKYSEAIKAYEEALAQQPDMADASTNKARIEDLLKKQQQQKKQEKSGKQDQSQQQKQSGDKKDQQQSGQDSKSGQQEGEQQQESSGQQNAEQKNEAGQQSKDKQDEGQNAQQSGEQRKQAEQASGKDDSATEKKGEEKSGQAQDKNQFAEAARELKKNAGKEQGDEEQEKSNAQQQAQTGKKPGENKKTEQQSQMAQPENPEQSGQPDDQEAAAMEADDLSNEEKLAAQQWLRRIPDDPGGLLRRKFKYQYQQRAQSQNRASGNPW